MMHVTRSGLGSVAMATVLAALFASACTAQVDGQASPDPAVTVAAPSSQSSSSTTTSRSRSSSSSSSSSPTSSASGREVLCLLIAPITSSATRSVNDYLKVANAANGPTPDLVAAEQQAIGALRPIPGQLRTLPGLSSLPPSDQLVTEVPAIATAVESVITAIPLPKSAPFNAATDNYNSHLDAIRNACR